MAFLDKLNQMAKNLGDKTSEAIETTKLYSQISKEKAAADAELCRIGAVYYERFAAGGEPDAEIAEFCQNAKAHYDAAAEAQAGIDRLKAEAEAPAPQSAAGAACPACGAVNAPGTRFCRDCGARLEPAAPPAARRCPACGTAVEPGIRFCGSCGQKMED